MKAIERNDRTNHFRIHSLRSASLFALFLALGCAGKTGESGSALSTCGASCTVDQITTSCSSTCTKLVQASCSKNQDVAACTKSCTEFGNVTNCAKAQDFLRCAEPLTPTCADGEPSYGAQCDALLQEAEKCNHRGPVQETVPGGAGGSASGPVGQPVPVDDPNVCPNIPRPTDLAGCSGAGSAPVEGVDAALQCSESCQDRTGNLWEASCSGSTCTCTYNRTLACTCVVTGTGPCASCCPGTGSL